MKNKNLEEYLSLLDKFIKPSRGGLNKSEIPQEINEKNKNSILSPVGIIVLALKDIYGINTSNDDFQNFQSQILKSFSKLASNNKNEELFSDNFNSFLELVVSSINIMNGMFQKLDENGIEFNPKQYLEDLYKNGNDECNE